MCLGPHYALKNYTDKKDLIYLDRCFWGDDKQFVTVTWMDKGKRIWPEGDNSRDKPKLEPMKGFGKGIVLSDWGRESEARTAAKERGFDLRLHPTVSGDSSPLEDVLMGYQRAAVYRGSSGVTAAIKGLSIEVLDEKSPCEPLQRISREQWLKNLSFCNFSFDELRSGHFWELLCRVS